MRTENGVVLMYDENGFLNNTKDTNIIRTDNRGNKYKYCSDCHMWKPIDKFGVKSNGDRFKTCTDCRISGSIRKGKAVENKEASQLQNRISQQTKQIDNLKKSISQLRTAASKGLSIYPDHKLIAELQDRGYRGTITKELLVLKKA